MEDRPPSPSDTPIAAARTGAATVRIGPHELAVPRERMWAFEGGEYYERNVSLWLDRMVALASEPVLYDAGANIGVYALRYAPVARSIAAFEPVASTFAVLERNVAANGVRNVRALRLALSDRAGEAVIHLWSSSGSNTLYARDDVPHEPAGTETVVLDRLDDVVAREGLDAPTVLKLDVEGAELPALRGAAGVLAEHRPHIVVECQQQTLEDAGYEPADLYAELERHGYVLRGLSETFADLRAHPIDAPDVAFANLLAVPPGSPLLRALDTPLG